MIFTAQAYSDRVVAFLQQKLEISNERSRTATINVFKHLVNSSGTTMLKQ